MPGQVLCWEYYTRDTNSEFTQYKLSLLVTPQPVKAEKPSWSTCELVLLLGLFWCLEPSQPTCCLGFLVPLSYLPPPTFGSVSSHGFPPPCTSSSFVLRSTEPFKYPNSCASPNILPPLGYPYSLLIVTTQHISAPFKTTLLLLTF